jgi:hypothetical protein
MTLSTRFFTRLAILIALTVALQMTGLPQPVTGTLVNFMLFVAVQILGIPAAVILGSLTPWVALLIGQLPSPLAPMIPFIMIGNAILVLSFAAFFIRSRSKSLRAGNLKKLFFILFAAVLKFLFLAVSVVFILPVILGITFGSQIAYLMTLPQLLTALSGGVLSVFFISLLSRIRLFSNRAEQ